MTNTTVVSYRIVAKLIKTLRGVWLEYEAAGIRVPTCRRQQVEAYLYQLLKITSYTRFHRMSMIYIFLFLFVPSAKLLWFI